MHIGLWMPKGPTPLVSLLRGEGLNVRVFSNEDELKHAAPELNAFMYRDGDFSPEVSAILRDHAKALRWVQLLSAGSDRTSSLGLPETAVLTTAGDVYAPAVAEHALGLQLALQRRIPSFAENQQARRWDRSETKHIRTLQEARSLVVGLGNIGREIANRLSAFGSTVVGVNRTGRDDPSALSCITLDRLDHRIGEFDCIFLSLSYQPQLRHLISHTQIELMRKSATIVNVGRGALVDPDALNDALRGGSIAGAGLDVTDPEPLPEDHPLWSAPNLVITPHVAAAAGMFGHQKLASRILENMRKFSHAGGEAALIP